jgi:hypothetical protein
MVGFLALERSTKYDGGVESLNFMDPMQAQDNGGTLPSLLLLLA